jgi:hypothetical protein
MTQPLYPREKPPGTHWIEDWVDTRVGVNDMEKWKFLTLPGLELQPVGREALPSRYVRIMYKSYPRNRPWRPIELWDVKDPTLSRQSAHS